MAVSRRRDQALLVRLLPACQVLRRVTKDLEPDQSVGKYRTVNNAAGDAGRKAGIGQPRQHLYDLLLPFQILARHRQDSKFDPVGSRILGGCCASGERSQRRQERADQNRVGERRRGRRKLLPISIDSRQ
jgi:hypothetical protein